ncbi:MAG: SDR family NAD(P)-dependent oxidoreductase [Planctomycetia bacterium]|nr:SDR family NAD(P)-dependent oxidoreductase [Planctomycetia bacterium]
MNTKLNPLAVITGASSGLGMAYARQLATKGFNLMLIARRKFVLESLKEELEKSHQNISVEIVQADLSLLDDIRMLEEKIANSERLLFMINNAGFGVEGVFPEINVEKNTEMITVHNTAVMRLARAAMIPMKVQGKGFLINVASSAGFLASRGAVIYCATKAFIISFSRSLQCDCHKDGIHVQALCPGFVRTGFHDTDSMAGSPIKESVPGWLWLQADWVVKKSLSQVQKNFFRRVIYIPSLRYKCGTFFASSWIFAPLRILFSGGKIR